MKRRSISSFISYTALAMLIAAGGCSKKSMSLGGSYSIEASTAPNYLSEPGGGAGPREIVYRKGGKRIVISNHPGPYYFQEAENTFTWHLYGEVLVYTDLGSPKGDSSCRLMAYSPTHGKKELDPDFRQYWKVIADDTGITCHRLQGEERKDDPHPKVFTAESLKALEG
jgi:hypothetical protein